MQSQNETANYLDTDYIKLWQSVFESTTIEDFEKKLDNLSNPEERLESFYELFSLESFYELFSIDTITKNKPASRANSLVQKILAKLNNTADNSNKDNVLAVVINHTQTNKSIDENLFSDMYTLIGLQTLKPLTIVNPNQLSDDSALSTIKKKFFPFEEILLEEILPTFTRPNDPKLAGGSEVFGSKKETPPKSSILTSSNDPQLTGGSEVSGSKKDEKSPLKFPVSPLSMFSNKDQGSIMVLNETLNEMHDRSSSNDSVPGTSFEEYGIPRCG